MKRIIGLVFSCAFLSSVACGSIDQGSELPPTVEGPGSQEQAAGTPKPVFHSVWSGASVSAYAGDAYSSTSLQAYENKSGKTAYSYFYLYSNAVDPTSQVCSSQEICWDPTDPSSCWTEEWCEYTRYSWTYAWGQLPEGDLKVHKSGVVLATDLADLNGYGEKCSVDYAAGIWDCQPLTTAGTIEVSWKANGLYSSFHNGVDQSSAGKYMYKNVGQYRSSSADVQGTILGVPVQALGDFSESMGAGVSRDLYKTP